MRWLQAFLVSSFIWSVGFTQGAVELSLQAAVQEALSASPDYIKSKNELETAELESKNAFSAFLPSLDLTARHGVRGYDPDTQGLTSRTPWASETTLALTENLYDNGETYKRYQIAKLGLERAQLQHHKVKAQIIRQVILAYYRLHVAVKNLEFVKKNFSELARLEKLVSDQFHQGLKTRKEFLSFKTRAQRSRLEVLSAEQEVRQAQTDLWAKMGRAPAEGVGVQVPSSTRMILPPRNFKGEVREEDLYAEKDRNLVRRISEFEVDLARRKYWPELSLVATAQYGSSDYIDTGRSWSENQGTQWGVFLNLKFNLLDWGVRSRNIRIAQVQRSSVEQTAQLELLQSQKDLEALRLEIEQSTESYQLAYDLQKMEQDTFQALDRDYKSGMTSYLELITGLSNLLDAQSRFLQTELNQADLYLRWKYHKGILDERTAFE